MMCPFQPTSIDVENPPFEFPTENHGFSDKKSFSYKKNMVFHSFFCIVPLGDRETNVFVHQEDVHRYLVLKNCVSVDSVKAGTV